MDIASLMIPEGLTEDEAVAELLRDHSKDILTSYARARCGWSGDEARTSKEAIARAVLQWHRQQGQGGATSAARLMPSRFPGICAACGKAFGKGERIAFDKTAPKGQRAKHEACAHLPIQHTDATAGADHDQQPAPARDSAPTNTTSDPARQIEAALRAMLAATPAALDADAVRAIVQGELHGPDMQDIIEGAVRIAASKLPQPDPVRIVVKGGAEVQIDEHTHPIFEKVVKLAGAGQSVLLKGPAGCGKSHLAAQVARSLGLDFGALHCSAGASESQLLGWLLPTGEGGRFEYVAAQFARMFAAGRALFLVDEIDASDPNFLMVLNGALANGHLHVPQNWKEPSVARGEGFAVIAAANTYGTGADALYVGRNQLDAATLDRFYVVEMDYDRKLEAKLAPAEVTAWAWNLRDRTAAAKLRRVVSTRTIQRVAAAMSCGFTFEQARADALTGWTRDELAKVGQ